MGEEKIIRCGIYGGSFNPVHNGHMQLLNYAKEAMLLDKVILMPTGDNPFKDEGKIARQNRVDMLTLATEGLHEVEISRIEIDRDGKSYTVDTMGELKDLFDYNFYFICGSDILTEFTKWKDFDKLCTLTRFICVLRRDVDNSGIVAEAERLNKEYGARIALLTDFQPDDISSSKIRKMIAENEDVSDMLSEKVYGYIKDFNLYV